MSHTRRFVCILVWFEMFAIIHCVCKSGQRCPIHSMGLSVRRLILLDNALLMGYGYAKFAKSVLAQGHMTEKQESVLVRFENVRVNYIPPQRRPSIGGFDCDSYGTNYNDYIDLID